MKTFSEKTTGVCSPFCSGGKQFCENINGDCVFNCSVGHYGDICDIGKTQKRIKPNECEFNFKLLISCQIYNMYSCGKY